MVPNHQPGILMYMLVYLSGYIAIFHKNLKLAVIWGHDPPQSNDHSRVRENSEVVIIYPNSHRNVSRTNLLETQRWASFSG